MTDQGCHGDERLARSGHDWDHNGVDRSLLRWMLSLRPIERLRVMEQHARGTRQLIELGRKRRERETRSG